MLRRLFVGLVVLVLGISVLVVTPAGAANTAVESLVDHDRNAATAQIRQFGGANRYATSVALAQAFRANSGAGGFVDTIIVASGESLIDAAAASGLAGSESAPVLLSRPDRLTRAVEDFIVEQFVSEVFIVGGTSVISQDVQDAIAALAPVRTVTRLAGADRYETAVAVAGEIGEPGVYCDTGDTTALLVNVDSSFADVIAVGPLAYSLDLPILLTSANALPAGVSDYLNDAEIERVVIVGGTAAVSESVVEGINSAGIDDVVRISGDNRYDTALEIRRALSECSTIRYSSTTIALVNGEAAADGVSAGPLLGLGLASNGVTPVLLVDSDGLPGETRSYLSSLPIRNPDASFVNLSLTAIGGTAVVPASVVAAAVEAATTSDPITATIRARVGTSAVVVTFSDLVDIATAQDRGNYRLNGGRLFNRDQIEFFNTGDEYTEQIPGSGSANTRQVQATAPTVYITFATSGFTGSGFLKEGDVISVVPKKIKGRGSDARTVQAADYTVPDLSNDRAAPRVSITAGEGGHEIRIDVDDPNLSGGADSIDLANIRINGQPLPTTAINFQARYRVPAGTAITPEQAAADTDDVVPWIVGETRANGNVETLLRTLTTSNGNMVTRLNRGGSELIVLRDSTDGETVDWLAQRESEGGSSVVICLLGFDREVYEIGADPGCRETVPPGDTTFTDATDRTIFNNPENTAGRFNFDETTISEEIGDQPSSSDYPAADAIIITQEVFDSSDLANPDPVAADFTGLLEARDRITVEAGAYRDLAGNASRSRSVTVQAGRTTVRAGTTVPRAPSVTRATVTSPIPYDSDNNPETVGDGEEAVWSWGRYIYLQRHASNYETDSFERVLTYLELAGRTDGVAAGAAGNDWAISWYELPAASNTNPAPEVVVSVIEDRKTIRIGFDQQARLEHAIIALEANDFVTANFFIRSDAVRTEFTGLRHNDDYTADLAPRTADDSRTLRPADLLATDLALFCDPDSSITLPVTEQADNAGAAVANVERPDPVGDCAATPTAGNYETGDFIDRGAPGQGAMSTRNFLGALSVVTVTLTYDDVIELFKYWTADATATGADAQDRTLRGANEGKPGYPTGAPTMEVVQDPSSSAGRRIIIVTDTAGWQTPSSQRRVLNVIDADDDTVITAGTYTAQTVDNDGPLTPEEVLLTQSKLFTTVTFDLISGNMAELPVVGGSITLPAGVAENYQGVASELVAAQQLRAA